MAVNEEIDEILNLKAVDVYHLSYNRSEREYELLSVIKGQNLRIFREVIDGNVDSVQRELSQRLALMKCKDWFYPLEKDKTHVYRYRDRNICYLFPDVSNPESVSILVLNPEVVDEIKVLLLENVLLLYCNLQNAPQEWKSVIEQLTTTPSAPTEQPQQQPQTQPQPQQPPQSVPNAVPMETSDPESAGSGGMADTIAKNIVYGAELLNNGISYGTQCVDGFMKRSAAQFKAKQSTQPTQNREIDPRIITGLRGLRGASHTAGVVTGYAVTTVAKGTNQLGKCLAPHVRRQSTKLISSISGKPNNESEGITDNIFTVASGGIQGFSTVFNGIAENAKILAKTLTNETVDIVNKRYGNEAANATEQALYTAGNTAVTISNVQCLGPKAIATRAAVGSVAHSTQTTDSNDSQRKT